jgi:hypothetical protein
MAQISELEKALNGKRDNGGMLGIRLANVQKAAKSNPLDVEFDFP